MEKLSTSREQLFMRNEYTGFFKKNFHGWICSSSVLHASQYIMTGELQNLQLLLTKRSDFLDSVNSILTSG